MRKILCVLGVLAFLLTLPVLCSAAVVDSGTCGENGDNVVWELDDQGVLTISGSGKMAEFYGYWEDEDQKDYFCDSPFYNNHNIRIVKILDGVSNISRNVFTNCSNLESIAIADSVKTIDGHAFYGCSGLKSITIPANIDSIFWGAFSGCKNLQTITIPKSATKIAGIFEGIPKTVKIIWEDQGNMVQVGTLKNGEPFFLPEQRINSMADGLLGGYSDLETINIPNGVTAIGETAFYQCSGLKSVSIPDGVTSIGERAFGECTSLVNISIPDSVTHIGDWAFEYCSSLKSIVIPNSIVSISRDTFSHCHSLVSVKIPNGVTSVGSCAFSSCYSLLDITIPDSVTRINSYAFEDCTSLNTITIPDGITTIDYGLFNGCTSLTNVSIPESVVSIGDEAFRFCNSLRQIRIPENVVSIGSQAFYHADSLLQLKIPQSITAIGEWAFAACDSLNSITIPANVKRIGSQTFGGCSLLSDVCVLGMDTEIAEGAFPYAYSWSGRTLYCYEYSTAEAWGRKHGWQVVLMDDENPEVVRKVTVPGEMTVALGRSAVIPADVFPATGTDLVWTSSDEAVAAVDQTGTVTGVARGVAEVTAESGGASGTCRVTVAPLSDFLRITLPVYIRLKAGESEVLYPDLNPALPDLQVAWSSDAPDIASVSPDGMVTGVARGTARITAEAEGVTATCLVFVLQPATDFSVPAEIWMPAKSTATIEITDVTPDYATMTDLTWSSDSPLVADVDGAGTVTTSAVGTANITVSESFSGLSRSTLVHSCFPVTDIRFDPERVTAEVGETVQLQALVTMRTQSCVNQLVTFTSADESVASVSRDGTVTCLKTGFARITAEANGHSASCFVTVGSPSVLILPAGTSAVESGAFTGLSGADAVRLPGGELSLADDAFDPGLALLAPAGSPAAEWGLAHGFNVIEE